MNGTSRLYRSTSERMLGGVAAGLGNYFKIDANIVRLIWLVLTLATGGGLALIYLALWLLLPTATSMATDVNGVIRENLNDMGAQFTNFTGIRINNGGNSGNGGNMGNAQPPSTPAETSTTANSGSTVNQPQITHVPQAIASSQSRQGAGPMPMILIGIGVFLLLANTGFFHGIHGGFWWPFLMIMFGARMLTRR